MIDIGWTMKKILDNIFLIVHLIISIPKKDEQTEGRWQDNCKVVKIMAPLVELCPSSP